MTFHIAQTSGTQVVLRDGQHFVRDPRPDAYSSTWHIVAGKKQKAICGREVSTEVAPQTRMAWDMVCSNCQAGR